MNIHVTVNGNAQEKEVDPRLLLVHFLRDDLGLTGTKIGCDTSQCGACVVKMDGKTVKSCTCLAVQADGSEITTIEGTRGVLGEAWPPMRLLHRRDDHHGDGVDRKEPRPF